MEATVKRLLSLFLLVLCVCLPLSAGIGSHDAMYVGGTSVGLSEKTEGKPTITDTEFVFKHKNGKFAIPYNNMNSLEYGQKAGRRVGMAIAISPLALFSKKRRHYLTIGYLDTSNRQQAAVFELGKDVIRPTLSSLEAKTGRTIDYQDDEARKTAGSK
jgi:hypothetical protein